MVSDQATLHCSEVLNDNNSDNNSKSLQPHSALWYSKHSHTFVIQPPQSQI